jgi:hypothetical protein
MHYAILNRSGNALEWFTDETDARDALAEMVSESPDAVLDLVAFEGPGRPVEPVSASARSAWPVARLVWSSQTAVASRNAGNLTAAVIKVESENLGDYDLGERDDGTDDRVRLETYHPA